jgi:hypothetical protein
MSVEPPPRIATHSSKEGFDVTSNSVGSEGRAPGSQATNSTVITNSSRAPSSS